MDTVNKAIANEISKIHSDAGKAVVKSTDSLPPHAKDTLDYINKHKGTECLIIGADGSVWYTNNHYMNFIQIK